LDGFLFLYPPKKHKQLQSKGDQFGYQVFPAKLVTEQGNQLAARPRMIRSQAVQGNEFQKLKPFAMNVNQSFAILFWHL
jgi:hypothetical protein